MKLQSNWNYEKSVEKVSGLVTQLKSVTLKKSTLTDEIAKELYEAREQLKSSGLRTDLVTNVTRLTWERYLSDCGLERMTVHRWLDHFEPEKQRLLTDDEYQAKQEAKRRAEMSVNDANKSMVSEALRTGKFPNGWNKECKLIYDAKIKEEKERDERINRNKAEMQRQVEERQKREDARKSESKEFDTIINSMLEKEKDKVDFVKKIGLSGNNASHAFNDALMTYLNCLHNDSERIEACHNIIKICKGVINDYQRKSVS